MKYFDVRFSSQLDAPSAWPAEAPPLVLLDLPARLQVPVCYAGKKTPLGSPPQSPPGILPLPAGTCVAKGQRLIAESLAQSETDAPNVIPIAPTSGRIVGMSRVMLLNGRSAAAIDLEPDFEDRPGHIESHDPESADEQQATIESLDEVVPEDLPKWIERFTQAGIWADRPGCPDLLEQLRFISGRLGESSRRGAVDTVICNLLDDEPSLRLNSVLASRSGPMLLAGLRLLGRLTRAANRWLIVEESAPGRWWSGLRKLIRRSRIDIVPLLNDYPRSDPTLLLYTLMGRRLKPGRLPVEKGVLMLDAAAAIAVGRFAARSQPMLQVPLAVRDHIHNRTHLLVVPVGTSVRRILQQTGTPEEGATILRGEVLHENAVTPDAVISGGELTLHVMPASSAAQSDPCIRCSWCVESCPTRVQPAGLLEACQRGDKKMARRYGLDACIECGVCTYVCPSHLPLLQGIRNLKLETGN